EIHTNSAQSGAGIAASGALTLTTGGGVTIKSNTATGNGGGIHASDSVLNVGSGTDIYANHGINGAGVYLASGNNILSGAIITGNVASNQGGGIYVTSSAPTLENLQVSQNNAAAGGGLYLTA